MLALVDCSSRAQSVRRLTFLSSGTRLTVRTDTEESLETCFAVLFYSRLRLILNLLPLLNKSSRPRVVSILNGVPESGALVWLERMFDRSRGIGT